MEFGSEVALLTPLTHMNAIWNKSPFDLNTPLSYTGTKCGRFALVNSSLDAAGWRDAPTK
jgi:hypothetical protein